MEEKATNLKEWTVEDVAREIEKKFDKDTAKKFEGKIDTQAKLLLIVSL